MSVDDLEASFVREALETSRHPVIAPHHRVELAALAVITILSAICYIAALAYELRRNWSKTWFFRFSQGQFSMPVPHCLS